MPAVRIQCKAGVLFGILEDGVLEMKCRHPECGVSPGEVIIHRFRALDGVLLDTLHFKEPRQTKKGR